MYPTARSVIAAVALLLLGTACSSDPPDDDPEIEDLTNSPSDSEPSDDPEPETDPEPTDDDPDSDPPPATEPDEDDEDDDPEDDFEDDFAVPDEIDADYAERVVNELLLIASDVTATVRDELRPGDMLSPEHLNILRSITTADRFAIRAAQLQGDLDSGFDGYRDDLGVATFDAESVPFTSDTCLVTGGVLDISDSAPPDIENPRIDYFFVLVPLEADRDVDGTNPTHWVLANEGATASPERQVFEDVCS